MRCLVLSDIHSNLEALQAVFDDAGAVDRVWCLGDVVGYGPNPNECVELLRERNPLCIAGNHDWATLGKLDLREFNPDAREANLWNREQLTSDNLEYLDALPETLIEGVFTLVHGSPRHPIWEYVIYPSTAEINFQYFDTPYCLIGHTHTPGLFQADDRNGNLHADLVAPRWARSIDIKDQRLFLNPGSVGQPRDGDPRASYLILDTQELTVQHRRIAYPVEETQARMMKADLPLRLIVRLGYGW